MKTKTINKVREIRKSVEYLISAIMKYDYASLYHSDSTKAKANEEASEAIEDIEMLASSVVGQLHKRIELIVGKDVEISLLEKALKPHGINISYYDEKAKRVIVEYARADMLFYAGHLMAIMNVVRNPEYIESCKNTLSL